MGRLRSRRGSSSLKRREAVRSRYPHILILCEGAKTEYYYLKSLCDEQGLTHVDVSISREASGNDPLNLVEFAREQALTAEQDGNSYDSIYVLFDRDGHARFNDALRLGEQLNEQFNLECIPSYPCFEFWILLHFEFTRKPYTPVSGSYSAPVENDIKRHLASYKKSNKEVFQLVRTRLENAIEHAKRSCKAAKRENEPNPSTLMHVVAQRLMEFAEERRRLRQK